MQVRCRFRSLFGSVTRLTPLRCRPLFRAAHRLMQVRFRSALRLCPGRGIDQFTIFEPVAVALVMARELLRRVGRVTFLDRHDRGVDGILRRCVVCLPDAQEIGNVVAQHGSRLLLRSGAGSERVTGPSCTRALFVAMRCSLHICRHCIREAGAARSPRSSGAGWEGRKQP